MHRVVFQIFYFGPFLRKVVNEKRHHLKKVKLIWVEMLKDTHREKHRLIKLQCLQKVQIWAFGSLVQQINSL